MILYRTRSLKESGGAFTDLRVGKGGLPPLRLPKDQLILSKQHAQSQGWEGGLQSIKKSLGGGSTSETQA